MEDIELVNEIQIEDSIKEERKWCVYMHRNKSNGKVYIGQTSMKPNKRYKKDGVGYKECSHFWNAIQKYGWDNFEHYVLFDGLTHQEANEIEIALIEQFDSMNPQHGYNLTTGGSENITMSQETRKKMSDARKGIPFTDEHKKNISNSLKGKIVSEETRKKLSESRIGKYCGVNNPNFKNHKLAGVNNPNYGKTHSAETKEKMSQKVKGLFAKEKNYFYNKHFCGLLNSRTRPIYCIELHEMFWGARDAEDKYGIAHQAIAKCCRGTRKSAGRHPQTHEQLHWLYIYDYDSDDGSIIQGAISLKYILQEEADVYLEQIKSNQIEHIGGLDNEN